MRSRSSHLRELILFAMLGTLMFCSKIIMEALPNIHLVGMLTMVYTIVFRQKALIPIYVFVAITGVYLGFNVWWIPYLYAWTILWGVTMLLPKKLPKKLAYVIYPLICGIHGFGNLVAGLMIVPLTDLMKKVLKRQYRGGIDI